MTVLQRHHVIRCWEPTLLKLYRLAATEQDAKHRHRLFQCPCTVLTVGLCKGTVSGIWKTFKIPTYLVSPQWIATRGNLNLYLDPPIVKGRCQPCWRPCLWYTKYVNTLRLLHLVWLTGLAKTLGSTSVQSPFRQVMLGGIPHSIQHGNELYATNLLINCKWDCDVLL